MGGVGFFWSCCFGGMGVSLLNLFGWVLMFVLLAILWACWGFFILFVFVIIGGFVGV